MVNLYLLAMTLIRSACCFILFVFLQNFASAQNTQPLMQDVFPPTPNAAALAKFGDVPVGLATGIPQINVPIFSYNKNGLKLNVSLDYHAGGVKQEEVASDVGIGWALNAGGQVSRTVRSLPDDYKTYGYFYLGYLYPFGHYMQAPLDERGGYLTTDSIYTFYHGLMDSQSDIFSYSINGKSAKFVYGFDGNYVSIPQTKVKVQRILNPTSLYSSLTGFVVTDIDGTQYYFMASDLIYNSAMNRQSSYTYSTAWNLTKIVAPFKTDSITISYESYNLAYQVGKYESEYTIVTRTFAYPPFDVITAGISTFTGTAQRIKQINLPDSTHVVFNYESVARKDITATGALKEILVKNGTKSYGYHLYHSYGANGAYTAGTVSPAYRLQMDSVTQFFGSTFLPAYKFTYNGTMPYRVSSAQDYWGFSTDSARVNSNTLIPKITTTATKIYDGSNRKPDTTKAKTGALITMQYPTRGQTNFTYESNRAGDGKLNEYYSQSINVPVTTYDVNYTKPFTVHRTVDSTYGITFLFKMTQWCPGAADTCNFIFSIKNTSGTVTYATATLAYSDLNVGKSVTLSSFANGNYLITWQFKPPSTCSCTDQFSFLLNYAEMNTDSTQLAGGIRLKKMVTYDGVSHANDMIREYDYTMPNGTSSGTVFLKPRYDYPYIATAMDDPHYGETNHYLVRNAAAFYPLSYANGTPVSYKRVTVRQNSSGGYLGKTLSTFTDFVYMNYTPCADDNGGNCPPFVTQPLPDFALGLPVSELTYDNSNNLMKKVNYSYNYVQFDDTYETPNYQGFKFSASSFSTDAEPHFVFFFYSTDMFAHTGRIEKTQELVTDYTTAHDSLTTETDYTYDPTYYNLKTSYTFNSKNQKIEERLYYPYDYTLSGAIGSLRDNNIIQPVVSSEEWITIGTTPYIRKAALTDYGFFQQGIIRPSKYYTLQATSPLTQTTIGAFNPAVLNRNTTYFIQDVSYDKFDSKGNISQVTNKVPVTSFIWDINKQYPIAKISNADSASVAYTSFEADGTGNWTIASALRDTLKAITGKRSYNLVNGNISIAGLTTTKSYLVSYWSKNGSYTLTNGGTPKTGVTLNGWTYYEHTITGAATLAISGSGNIDELRLYPVYALMNTYTYDPFSGVTSMVDARSGISYYEYDGLKRLINIKDQYGNIIKSFCYNYAGQVGCPIVLTYFNAVQAITYYRNNCSTNYVGSAVVYTVPAGAYTSTISQADADSKATADETANGQNYANANGTCTLCTGNAYKIINHACELGNKVYTASVPQGSQYLCTYHYEWSDGSHSVDYTELHSTPCSF